MKKLLAIVAILGIANSHAQQSVVAKKVSADSLKIKDQTIGEISQDSTALSKMPKALISEWAAKNYTDNKINAIPKPVIDTNFVRPSYPDITENMVDFGEVTRSATMYGASKDIGYKYTVYNTIPVKSLFPIDSSGSASLMNGTDPYVNFNRKMGITSGGSYYDSIVRYAAEGGVKGYTMLSPDGIETTGGVYSGGSFTNFRDENYNSSYSLSAENAMYLNKSSNDGTTASFVKLDPVEGLQLTYSGGISDKGNNIKRGGKFTYMPSYDTARYTGYNQYSYTNTKGLMYRPDNEYYYSFKGTDSAGLFQLSSSIPMEANDSSFITRMYADSRYASIKNQGLTKTQADTTYLNKDSIPYLNGAAVFFNPNSWWYNSSLAIGANVSSVPNTVHSNSNLGEGNLLLAPNISTDTSKQGTWNTVLGSMIPDGFGNLNTLVGCMPSGTVGHNNAVVTSRFTNWGGISFGDNNAILGANIISAGNNNVIIGRDASITGGSTGNDQINIGGYIYKGADKHFGLNRWAQSGVAVDLASNLSDGGLLTPKGTTDQRKAISSPIEGLIFYDTTLHCLCFYNGTKWQKITSTDAD